MQGWIAYVLQYPGREIAGIGPPPAVAMAAFLLIVLFWALGRLGESIGEVWDIFKAGS